MSTTTLEPATDTSSVAGTRRLHPRWGLMAPALLVVAFGVVGPFVILAGYSVKLLGDDLSGSRFGFYTEVLTDSFYLGIFWRTIKLSTYLVVVTLLLGYPLAVIITRARGWKRTLLLYATITPLLTNIVVRTLGWLVMLSDQGIVNGWLGWIDPSFERRFLGTELGLLLSLVHIALPLMVLPMLTTIESQDPTHAEAALVCGAHPIVAWWRVTLPSLAPGLIAGCTLVFVLGMSSLITPSMLGRGRMYMVSTLLVRQIGSLNWGRAAALALLLFAVVLLVVGAMQRLGSRSASGGRAARSSIPLARRPVAAALSRLNALGPTSHLVRWIRPVFVTAIVVYLLLPLAVVLKSSFDPSTTLRAGWNGFTLEWYRQALDPDRYLPSALLSLRLATLAVIIGLAIALPASLAIARGSFPGRKAIIAFLMSPLLLPHAALAVGFVLFFLFLGTDPSFQRVLFAHLVVCLPYMVRVLVSALESVDPSLEEAARTAGASPFTALRRVTLPLIKPGIFAAVLFGFLTSFDEATVGVLVAASGTPTLPVKIFSDLQVQYTPVAAAVSGLLILLVLAVILPLERWVGLMAPRDGGRQRRRRRRSA